MRRWILALVAAAGFLSGSLACGAPPEVEDVLLTIKVRAILYQDVELRSHNIGVRVVDRVAILFGPVTKLDLGLRAESRLRDLIELRDVRNELDLMTPLPDFLPQRLSEPAPGLDLRPRPEVKTPRPALTRLQDGGHKSVNGSILALR
ncbi:MAG: BON domain-containing protein [Planctomycetota bacterium]